MSTPNREPQTLASLSAHARSLIYHQRTYWIVLLAFFPLSTDLIVLFVTFHKFKFGAQVVGQNWPIHDSSITQIISVLSTLLRAITAYLGGLAITQLWAREVFQQRPGGKGGTLAELQSLGVFQSTPVMIIAFWHFVNGRFYPRWIPWMFSLISAIFILLYPTALITLGSPTLTRVQNSLTTYQYTDLPFMTNPGYCGRCSGVDSHEACLGNLIAGSAMTDIGSFDPTLAPFPIISPPQNPLWMALRTAYSTFTTIQVSSNLGPLNNIDMSSGAILMAQNFGTLERLLADGGKTPPTHKSVFDSAAFSIGVNTTTPFLISQCIIIEQNGIEVSAITIRNATYHLPTPVALVNERSVVAQITSDNMTLIISFKPDGTSDNIHCAIRLGLRLGRVFINGASSISAYPFEDPWDWGDLSRMEKNRLSPIGDFAAVWLRGMGWNGTAVRNSVSEVLTSSRLSVGTDSIDNNNVMDKGFAEYYTLAMLSGGINIAFPQETLDPTASEGTLATRSYQVTKTQYYVGLITPSRRFWIFAIFFNFIFILVCLVIIFVLGGWLPDWTEPITLLCTTLLDDNGDCLRKSCPDLRTNQDIQENPPHSDSDPKDAWSYHMFTTYAPNNVLVFAWTPKFFASTPSANHNGAIVSPQMQNATQQGSRIHDMLPSLSHHQYSRIPGSGSELLQQLAIDPQDDSSRQSSESSQGASQLNNHDQPEDRIASSGSSQQTHELANLV